MKLTTHSRIEDYDLEAIKDAHWLSNKQQELVNVLLDTHYNQRKAAKKLNIAYRVLQGRVHRLKRAILSHSNDALVPEGMLVKGVSTYYSVDEETGKKREKGQWIKVERDKEQQLEALKEVTRNLAKVVDGLKPATVPPTSTTEGLLTVYVTTDMHLGQYAWHEEAGKDVNVDIVYNNTLNAHNMLCEMTMPSEEAIIADLGDTLHASNDANRTKSGHELDVDSRHAKVFQRLVDLKIAMIDRALEKHSKVKYIIVAGNHSDLVGHYLVAMLKAYYRNEPRFEVDTSSALHKYHKHGKTLLGFHHGHSTPINKLPEVMVWDRKDDISATDFRYWLTGHVHKDTVIDNPISRVESFRNLTSNDAWAAGAGFRGHKQATAITYSDEYGEVARNIVNIKQVEVKAQ